MTTLPSHPRLLTWLAVAAAVGTALVLGSGAHAQAGSKCGYSSIANNYPNPTIIHFDTGKTTIAPEGAKQIAATAKLAKSNYIQQVCVRGFADKQGNAAANQKLSLARANAVAAELRKNGVDPKTIVAEAAGEPGGNTGSDSSFFATRSDRRVEIRFTK